MGIWAVAALVAWHGAFAADNAKPAVAKPTLTVSTATPPKPEFGAAANRAPVANPCGCARADHRRQRPCPACTPVARSCNTLYQNGQCPSDYWPMLGQASCQYNAYRYATLYPQQNVRRLMLSAERLLPGGAMVYEEALYSTIEDDDFKAQAWRSVTFSIGNLPDSVGYQEAVNAGLDPSKTLFRWSPTPLEGLKNK